MTEKPTRTTILHQWITIVGLPAVLLISAWGATTMINLLGAQRELAVHITALNKRADDTQRDMTDREARVLRLIERLEDRMETRIVRPPL